VQSKSTDNNYHRNEQSIMLHEIESKLDNDYRPMHGLRSLVPALVPLNVKTEAIKLVKNTSFSSDSDRMRNNLRKVIDNWDNIFHKVKSVMNGNYEELISNPFDRAWIKAQKQANLSDTQKLVFCCKETLTPLFIDHTSPILQECITQIGREFKVFAETTFMAAVVQDLLGFVIEQIYIACGGPGASNKRSWRNFLIALCLFILRWIVILLIQWALRTYLSDDPLIVKFLETVTASFVAWAIEILNDKLC
jgi:hypothetical protein